MHQSDSNTSKGLELVSRIGYSAKGIVYVIVGVLAVMAAIGLGGQTTGTKGAIRELAGQPFGQILLLVLALGLVGHMIWRFAEAWADPDHKGSDFKGLAARAGFALSGVIYGTLAFYTVGLVTTAIKSSGGDDSSSKSRTAEAMSYPGGEWLVAAVGLGFIAVGAYQAWRAYKKTFRKAWDTASMNSYQSCWADRIARVGLSARAVVFALVGII